MNKIKKVYIAIPTTGNIRTELLGFLLNIIHTPNYQIKIDTTSFGDTCGNRNLLTNRFLESDSEWMMTCDSDIIPPMDILSMIDESKDIISPVNFAWKGSELIPLIMNKVKTGYQINWKLIKSKNNVLKTDAVGLGCCFIHRRVLEKLKKPHFEFRYDKKGLLNNDDSFYFCDKVRQIGFNIWVDKRYMTSHFSTVDLKAFNNFLSLQKRDK